MDAVEREIRNNDILLYFEYLYDIPKHEDFDNEVYYPIYYSDKRYIHLYGGRAGAKSAEAGKLVCVLLSCLDFCRILGIRNVHNTIRSSLFQEILDYISKWELDDHFKVKRSELKITHIESGNYIIFRGMDNPSKIKSIKDITHAIFEECFEIKDEEGVDKIDKSIRTPRLEGFPHQLIFIYNTDNRSHWLFDFYHNEDEKYKEQFAFYRQKALMIKTTYKDNKFLPSSAIELIESDKVSNPERYQVDALGNWGVLQTSGRFYSTFNYTKQAIVGLKDEKYDRHKNLHVTLDFNVDPYIALICNQIFANDETNTITLAAIDEICLTEDAKMGRIIETMKAFLLKYRRHIGRVVLHGDRSATNRNTSGHTDFATVFDMLRPTPKSRFIKAKDENGNDIMVDPFPEYDEYGCRFEVIDGSKHDANPMLKYRKKLFQDLFEGRLSILPLSRSFGTKGASGRERPLSKQYGGWLVEMLVDQDNCPKLLRDYLEVLEDVVKGGKSSRPYHLTHASDSQDYFVTDILDAELEFIMSRMK